MITYSCAGCGKVKRNYVESIAKVNDMMFCTSCFAEMSSQVLPEAERKDGAEKTRMELLPMNALEEVAKVLTYGAKKYALDNRKKVPDARERYTGALLRHLAAWREGEVFDKEIKSGDIRHIAQVACNALFLVWLELNEGRPSKEFQVHYEDENEEFYKGS